MTSQNSLLLFKLVDVLKWWYRFISVDTISIAKFQTIIAIVFAWCCFVKTLRYEVTEMIMWREMIISLQMGWRADSILLM